MQTNQDQAGDTTGRAVIVGGGQAGGESALEMRKLGFKGEVLILGEEDSPPYTRPALHTAYFAGMLADDSLDLLPTQGLERSGIRFRGGIRVESLDRATRTLRARGE